MSAEAIARLRARLSPVGAPLGRGFSDFDLHPEHRPAGHAATREAAVLVALIERAEGLNVVLTRRTADMPTHAGQVAFPGGRRDPGDRDAADNALREAREEIGLDPALVEVLGVFETYETVTGYRVTPVVGLVDPAARFTRDPREVDAVFEAPFAFLMDPANHQRHWRDWNGARRYYYAMPYRDHYIWGATAGMLRALYRRLHDLGEDAA